MPTSTVEDYLKSILHLDDPSGPGATVGAIASDLGVTPGTVSSMMRHLSEQGLVDYSPRKSVTLLPAGRQQALRVVRRHRLIESFLVTVMKLDWSVVHQEAEVLEHAISDRLLQRMDEMLGFPSQDPHGHPIPDDLGHMTGQEARPLSQAAEGRYLVVRVDDSDPGFLDWLRQHHLQPGAGFERLAGDPLAGVIELVPLTGDRNPVFLAERAAARILVRELTEARR